MPAYRLYIVREDGHFADVKDVEFADDEAALDHARQLLDGRAVELWERGRLIARLDPEEP